MTGKLVRLSCIETRLRIPRSTLEDWGRKGKLCILWHENKKHCFQDGIDTLLKHGATGPYPAFTWAEIVAKDIKFLTSAEVKTLLGLTMNQLKRRRESGKLAAVQLVRNWLYTTKSVIRVKRTATGLSHQQVGHILGVATRNITPLVNSGQLVASEAEGSLGVTPDSLLKLLSGLLPAWIDPYGWIEDRLESPYPLAQHRTLWASDADEPLFAALIAEGKIQYIHSKRGVLVSPESHAAYVERNEPQVTYNDLARLFGVSKGVLYNWNRMYPGWLACTYHPHTTKMLYRPCVFNILKSRLSKGGSAHMWYDGRLKQNVPAIDESTAMAMCGIHAQEEFRKIIENHRVTHLTTPDNKLRFSCATIIKVARKCWAARSD